jgi:copper(I)-binding protein
MNETRLRGKKILRIAHILLLIGLVAGCAAPTPSTLEKGKDRIYIENVWMRPSPLPEGNSAIYFTIVNPLDRADRLLAVSSQLGMTGLHESVTENNIVRMEARPDGFEIAPRSSLELTPGGKHIMVMGIAEPLAVGETVTVTLNFEMVGDVTIAVPVAEKP